MLTVWTEGLKVMGLEGEIYVAGYYGDVRSQATVVAAILVCRG